MKIQVLLIILASAMSTITCGCKPQIIPQGIYKPTDPYKPSTNINGREVQIEELKVDKDFLTFLLKVEQNDSTRNIEKGLEYQLDNNSRIVLLGNSASTIYNNLNTKYLWQYKDRCIEQLSPKDLSVVTTYSK